MTPWAPPGFLSPDQGPLIQHFWPSGFPGFQSTPLQLALLTHAVWQSPRVFASTRTPSKTLVCCSSVQDAQPTRKNTMTSTKIRMWWELVPHDTVEHSDFNHLEINREHGIQRITFAAETNAACSRGSADRQTHTHCVTPSDTIPSQLAKHCLVSSDTTHAQWLYNRFRLSDYMHRVKGAHSFLWKPISLGSLYVYILCIEYVSIMYWVVGFLWCLWCIKLWDLGGATAAHSGIHTLSVV